MVPSSASPPVVCFDVFEVDLRSAELRKPGSTIRLQDKPLLILTLLLEHPGEVVTREELQKRLWPNGIIVDFERSINTAVSRLREALGDDPEHPRFIETLPRRGYRFIAPVDGRAGSPQRPLTVAAMSPLPMAVAPLSSPAIAVAAISDRRTAVGTPPLQERRRLAIALASVVVVAGAILAYWLTRSPAPPPELKERRLTANPSDNPVNQGAISPDGKYLAYGDQVGLHLKLLQSGEVLNIPQPEGRAPDFYIWWPTAWFPDGTRFIASAYAPGKPTSAWVVSVMGGPPHKLRDNASPWAVSPDGKLIAFGNSLAAGVYDELQVMGAQGEDPRRLVVAASENDRVYQAAWSPDGQRVAYGRYQRTPGKDQFSIESRDLKGGQPTVMLSGPRLVLLFWWLPSGRFVYVMTEPESLGKASNLWEVRVDTKTGKPVSKPRRITNWMETNVIDVRGSSDGKQLTVTKATRQEHVYVGELEAGGRRVKNLRPLILEESGDFPSHWMPDGKAVLFASNRNGTWGIYKQELDQTTAQPVATGPDYKEWPVVSPDGSWILYLSRANPEFTATTAVRIMRVPTSGGPAQQVLEGHGIAYLACARSPATLCVFSEESPDHKQLIFSGFEPSQQARRRELTRVNSKRPWTWGFYSWDLSPDGSRLAFTQEDMREGHIQILPVAGGEVREVNVKGWSGLFRLFWAAEGNGLFVSANPTATRATLLHADLDGGSQVLWQQRFAGGTGIPSPDGHHLAMVGLSFDSNVWLLENF